MNRSFIHIFINIDKRYAIQLKLIKLKTIQFYHQMLSFVNETHK